MQVYLLALLTLCYLGVFRQVLGDTCGGNCPSNYCPSCPCGASPQYANIPVVCAYYGGWSQTCCQFIVTQESGGDFNAANYNPTSRTYDVGLWQINQNNWPSCSGGSAPCTLNSNLMCAINIFQLNNTWQYWPTCGACECCNIS